MIETIAAPRARQRLLPAALRLARIAVAGLFIAHAITRIYLGTIPQFGLFMETQGFPSGEIWVWGITAIEIAAGLLLVAGRQLRAAASALLAIVIGGIVLIHRHFGWFVGEHGTGGSEYSVALVILLLIIIADDHDRRTDASG